jgi:hypothetical protein
MYIYGWLLRKFNDYHCDSVSESNLLKPSLNTWREGSKFQWNLLMYIAELQQCRSKVAVKTARPQEPSTTRAACWTSARTASPPSPERGRSSSRSSPPRARCRRSEPTPRRPGPRTRPTCSSWRSSCAAAASSPPPVSATAVLQHLHAADVGGAPAPAAAIGRHAAAAHPARRETMSVLPAVRVADLPTPGRPEALIELRERRRWPVPHHRVPVHRAPFAAHVVLAPRLVVLHQGPGVRVKKQLIRCWTVTSIVRTLYSVSGTSYCAPPYSDDGGRAAPSAYSREIWTNPVHARLKHSVPCCLSWSYHAWISTEMHFK